MRQTLLFIVLAFLATLPPAHAQNENVWVGCILNSGTNQAGGSGICASSTLKITLSSPNACTIGTSVGSSAVITPLFVTDDGYYVNARIEHPHSATHTVTISNGYNYATSFTFSGGTTYFYGYIPSSNQSSTIDKIIFTVTYNP